MKNLCTRRAFRRMATYPAHSIEAARPLSVALTAGRKLKSVAAAPVVVVVLLLVPFGARRLDLEGSRRSDEVRSRQNPWVRYERRRPARSNASDVHGVWCRLEVRRPITVTAVPDSAHFDHLAFVR